MVTGEDWYNVLVPDSHSTEDTNLARARGTAPRRMTSRGHGPSVGIYPRNMKGYNFAISNSGLPKFNGMGESYSVGACCAKGVPFLLSPLIITDPAACYCVRHVYQTPLVS